MVQPSAPRCRMLCMEPAEPACGCDLGTSGESHFDRAIGTKLRLGRGNYDTWEHCFTLRRKFPLDGAAPGGMVHCRLPFDVNTADHLGAAAAAWRSGLRNELAGGGLELPHTDFAALAFGQCHGPYWRYSMAPAVQSDHDSGR